MLPDAAMPRWERRQWWRATGQRFGCSMISAITNRGALAFMVFAVQHSGVDVPRDGYAVLAGEGAGRAQGALAAPHAACSGLRHTANENCPAFCLTVAERRERKYGKVSNTGLSTVLSTAGDIREVFEGQKQSA